jgi:uncharacterized protein YjaZ
MPSYVPPHLRKSARIPEIRRKVYVIPIINDNKYIVVQNAGKYKNITFIGGGCGKNENIRNCAVRELSEETRQSIRLNRDKIPNKPILTFNVSPNERNASKMYLNNNTRKGVSVTMKHSVFMVPLVNFSFNKIKSLYHSKTNLTRAEQEAVNIYLMNRNQLNKSQMWDFMRKRVFYPLIKSSSMK